MVWGDITFTVNDEEAGLPRKFASPEYVAMMV